jgi:hypothetical protein
MSRFAERVPELGALLATPPRPAASMRAPSSPAATAAAPASPGPSPLSLFERARDRRARRSRVWAVVSFAVAAVVALGVGLRGLERDSDESGGRAVRDEAARDGAAQDAASSGFRSKGGGLALGFVVRRAERDSEGHAGDVLHPGDVLRFTLGSSRAGYAGVWGIDAKGSVSALGSAEALVPVAAGPRQVLPGAVELDDTLGEERLVAVLCAHPLSIAELSAALAAPANAVRLPPGCSSDTLPIRKARP